MAEDRKNEKIKGIEPDSKSQVTMLYENEKPIKVTSVVISTQHSKHLDQEKVREVVIPYIKKSIPRKIFIRLKSKRNLYKSNWPIYNWWTRWRYWFDWKKNYS